MSKEKLGQEPAFPLSNDTVIGMVVDRNFSPEGMSKRYLTACMAMKGLMSNPKMFDNMLDFKSTSVKELIIERCYDYADEMLKQENL